MRSVVFTDIDETLVHSVRRRAAASDDHLAAVDKNGVAVSYQSRSQRALWEWMRRADRIVAVTGRSAGAYSRVRLPFEAEAIVHHGAQVLQADGSVDAAYAEQVRADLLAHHAALADAWAGVDAWIRESGAPLRTYRQVVDDLTVEVCVKHVSLDATDLGQEGEYLRNRWAADYPEARLHHNGNNLALLPGRVDKRRAVRWVRAALEDSLGPILAVGAGDSLTDLPFLTACDFYLVPSGSQLDHHLGEGAGA